MNVLSLSLCCIYSAIPNKIFYIAEYNCNILFLQLATCTYNLYNKVTKFEVMSVCCKLISLAL